MTEAVRETIRLDKWLWQARFFKSRGIAAERVSSGKVRVNSQPVSKPSRNVGEGDVLTFAQGRWVRVVRIVACGDRRGPAPEARLLYDDLSDPPPKPDPAAPVNDRKGRPTGRDRRRLDAADRRLNDPLGRDS
ncbi:RNA-binding S4 domain-containing protein [Ponticoccus sp. SC2-23]|uniref:RNA-binding S4 domain-containing protein n=1 Tax=Alexandriicola marinus TaxID=2081710 RepID=UPI000FD784BB|nr:RNA-binding S4 domain-containing protein [Alexandriicola marinus]MBM1221066.1 RNA-binding S4 domain-containing protein [Ponticoccus sp. SC6-9]MBM1225636.1 RNA-binding S4 domain-containing protein [Ponticoccus sp. SC6-15]MBM1227788.1 RNA-binding S4 domain-containing protein [Ponticoccus sp. SC6-38]MBM1234574.1 RNA-binding S4 domain-containing protein [Ponticoccus sp. SC6-45]MBM1238290.1 RNA-binding S4 domain-containing protein [Ponticoccus sp. SC6-49]MBM1243559.1 RNA-binding S4 domain-conta